MAKKGKRPNPSAGGRTPGEAGLAASMAAGGKNVSPTNLNVAKGYPVPKGVTQVLGSGTVTGSGTGAVLSVKKKRPRVTKKGARVADRVFGVDLVGDLSVARQQAKARAKRARKGKPVKTRDPRGSGLAPSPKPAPKNAVARSQRKIRRIQNRIGSIKSGTNTKPLLLGASRLSRTPSANLPKKRELKRLGRKLDAAKIEKRDRVFARRVNKQVRQIKQNTIKSAPAADRPKLRRELNQMTKTQRDRNKLLAAINAEADKKQAKEQGNYSNVSEIIRDEQGRNIGARQVPKLNTRYRQGTDEKDVNYNLRLLRKDLLKGRERNQPDSLGSTLANVVTEGIPEVAADYADVVDQALDGDFDRAKRAAERGVKFAGLLNPSTGPATAVKLGMESVQKDGSIKAPDLFPWQDPETKADFADYANVMATMFLAGRLGAGALKAGKAFQALRNVGRSRVFTVGPKGAASTKIKYFGPSKITKEAGAAAAFTTTKTAARGGKVLGVAKTIGDSRAYQLTRKGVGIGVLAGATYKHDWTLPAIEGTAQALIDDPITTLETTARGLISGVTSPIVILANMGMAARTGNTKPLEYMADAFIKEGEALFHVYTSGDAAVVKKATIEDYGLINVMGAGWLTRPLWKGVPGKVTRGVAGQLPSGLDDGRTLAQRWDRWTADMRAAGEATIESDREKARAAKGKQDALSRIYKVARKINNGLAGRKLNKILLAAFDREVDMNADQLAAVLAADKRAAGDNPLTAREQMAPNAEMSKRQIRAQAKKKTRPALTVADLAVFLQSRDAPMSFGQRWIDREKEASNGPADMVELRALEMAKELWEDGDTADLFRQLRAEMKTVDLQIQRERDAIFGEPIGSRASDQETAIAIEREQVGAESGMRFVGGINPYRVDADGNERLERPEVMMEDKVASDLAAATAIDAEIKVSRKQARALDNDIKRVKVKLQGLRERDDLRRKAVRETSEDAARREAKEKIIAGVSREIEELTGQLARGADIDQIRLQINALVRQAEKDAAKLDKNIDYMRKKNPGATEALMGTQVWSGSGAGKLESDLGYQIVREDLLDEAPGSNKKHWWAVAPDGSLIGWKSTRETAKALAADHRALTPDETGTATAIAGTFQRDRGGAALESEMRRPQIMEEYGLFVADLVRRLKASRGTGGKRAEILEHRFQEGFWAGGSEPSFLSLISINDPTVVRAMAAAIGYHFEQDAMAVFRADSNGPDATLELTLKDGISTDQVDAALESMTGEGGTPPGGSKLGNKAYFYLIDDDDPDMFINAFADLTEGEAKLTRGHVDFIDRDEYRQAIEAVPEVRQAANSYGERWGGRTHSASTGTSFSREAEGAVPATQGGRAGRQPNPEDEVGFYTAEVNRLRQEGLLLERSRGNMEGRLAELKKRKREIISDLRNRKAKRRRALRNYKRDYRIARRETDLDNFVKERDALKDRIGMLASERQRIMDDVRGRLTPEELDAEVAAVLTTLGITAEDLKAMSTTDANKRTAEMTAERELLKTKRLEDERRRTELFDRNDEELADEIAQLDQRINDAYTQEAVLDMLISDRRFQNLTEDVVSIISEATKTVRREKAQAYQEKWLGIFNTLYQQQLDHYRAVVGAEGAIHIPNKPRAESGVASATPAYPAGFGTRKEYLRTGAQARSGDVDRSFEAWVQHIDDHYTFVRNLNMSVYLVGEHALEADLGMGAQKLFTDPEIERLELRNDLDGWVKVNQRLIASPNLLFQVMGEKALRDRGPKALQDALDGAVKQLDTELDKSVAGIEDPKVRAEAVRRRTIAKAQEGEGQKYYLIRRSVVQRLFDEERMYQSKLLAVFAKGNTLVSKAVLGTSFAWAFAQPIAEWLVWAADDPKGAARFMELRTRRAQAIAEDPESARRLAYLAATTLGTDSISSRSTRSFHNETSQTIKLARQTDIGYLIEEIVKIRALGNLDKMKGAAIREFAVLAAIDKNLSTLGRSAKAVKGQMDEIEKVADKLKNMSDAERLRFLDSEEGRAAGLQIINHIDESLGNWSALSPLERPIAAVIFFYPFVRFSINWVLRTYPKNHPVRWTLATVLGQMNAEIMEDFLKADPTYSSGWAAAPIWGPDSSTPVGLLQLNRIAVGGNSFFEFLGERDPNLTNLLLNTLNPAVSIPLGAAFGRDEYGNPLEDADSPFSNDPLTFGDTVRSMASSAARLSPLSREFLRYNSLHIEGPFASPDWSYKFMDPSARKAQPGDDRNKIRDGIRRLALPFAVPEDTDTVIARYTVNELWERYGTALNYSSKTYSEPAARAREYAENEEAWLNENADRSFEAKWIRRNGALSEFKRTDPNYAQYMREWGTKQEAEDQADKIALAIGRIYRKTNTPLPDSNGLKERLAKPRNERLDVKERWESLNPGVRYPGYGKALSEIASYESGGIIKSPKVNIKSVYTSDDRVGAPVVKQLRASSRKNMGKGGNIKNPLDDPRTEVVEKGKRTIVTNYRGKEVLGNMTLDEVKNAERNGTIGIDDDGRITTPKTRKAIANVEGVGEQAGKLLDAAAKLQGQAGGRIDLPGDEGAFINELARLTGMDARVLAAWTKSEGGNSYGDYNLLNIGHTGSGPNSAASNSDFSTPKSAAAATAAFLRGEWGGPGAGIPYIIEKARGKDPVSQIKVIEESGWRTGSVGADPGYWQLITDVYNEQPPTIPANPKAKKALDAMQPQIKAARKAYANAADQARALGIKVDPLDEPGASGTISWGDKKARQIDGAWAGTMRILARANRGDFTISSDKRTPEENASVGGSPVSDHLTTNTNSYAHDIPATGADGQAISEAYWKRLKLNEPLAIGTYNNYTSRKYPGYTFQILWEVDGHFDHVHVGARYTGEDLPAGTYSGGPAGTSVGGGGAIASVGGGGGSLPATGGGGGAAMPEMKFADLAKGFGGIESGNLPSVAETLAEASGNTGGDGVESVAEQLAKLPKAKKKQKLPKFDPSTRI